MPTAILPVVPQGTGDYLGFKRGNAIALPAGASGAILGWQAAPPITGTDIGWVGRFELPIPNGATITGVSLSFSVTAPSYPLGAPVTRQAGGLLAPDGIWNSFGGTLSVAHYPTRPVFPWPEVDFLPVPARWFGGAPSFLMDTWASVSVASVMSFGEGIAATNAVSGLLASLQSWLDTYGATLRGGSASGTDLPVALCWYRAFSTFLTPAEGFPVWSSSGAAPNRPFLTVSWTEGETPSSVSARSRVRPAAHGLLGTFPAARALGARLRPGNPGHARIR